MEDNFCHIHRNKTTNFIFSLIVYFVLMSLIAAAVSYYLTKDAEHGYMPVRFIGSIYFAATRRIKFFKEK